MPERRGYSGAITADPGESVEIDGRTFSVVDPIVEDDVPGVTTRFTERSAGSQPSREREAKSEIAVLV